MSFRPIDPPKKVDVDPRDYHVHRDHRPRRNHCVVDNQYDGGNQVQEPKVANLRLQQRQHEDCRPAPPQDVSEQVHEADNTLLGLDSATLTVAECRIERRGWLFKVEASNKLERFWCAQQTVHAGILPFDRDWAVVSN